MPSSHTGGYYDKHFYKICPQIYITIFPWKPFWGCLGETILWLHIRNSGASYRYLVCFNNMNITCVISDSCPSLLMENINHYLGVPPYHTLFNSPHWSAQACIQDFMSGTFCVHFILLFYADFPFASIFIDLALILSCNNVYFFLNYLYLVKREIWRRDN